MKIEILGTGCAKCKLLEERAREAANLLGLAYDLEKVSDYPGIVARGVMSTPAMLVDGVIKVQGQVPTAAALAGLLKD